MRSLTPEKISARRARSQTISRMARVLSLVMVRTGREGMQPIMMGLLWFGFVADMMEWKCKLSDAAGFGRGVSIFKSRRGRKSDILDTH